MFFDFISELKEENEDNEEISEIEEKNHFKTGEKLLNCCQANK